DAVVDLLGTEPRETPGGGQFVGHPREEHGWPGMGRDESRVDLAGGTTVHVHGPVLGKDQTAAELEKGGLSRSVRTDNGGSARRDSEGLDHEVPRFDAAELYHEDSSRAPRWYAAKVLRMSPGMNGSTPTATAAEIVM